MLAFFQEHFGDELRDLLFLFLEFKPTASFSFLLKQNCRSLDILLDPFFSLLPIKKSLVMVTYIFEFIKMNAN